MRKIYKRLTTCSEFWSKKKKVQNILGQIPYALPTTHHKFHIICNHFLFSHLEIKILISINVTWYVLCKRFQKLCYDSSGIFYTLTSSQSSLLYLSCLVIVLNIALLWQNSAHQRTQEWTICFLYCWKTYRGEPQFGTQMPGYRDLALVLFRFKLGE